MALRPTQHIVLLLAAAALYGCGGAQPKQTGEENNFGETPSGTGSPAPDTTDTPKWSSTPSPKSAASTDTGGLSEDQKAQMEIALRRGGDKAANCASVVPDGPKGEGEVKVTFDGTKGRSVDASVGPPFAGTPMEACIKRSFIGEIVVPFEGELEVPYTVKVGVKGGGGGNDAKDKDTKDKGKDTKDTKDKGKKK